MHYPPFPGIWEILTNNNHWAVVKVSARLAQDGEISSSSPLAAKLFRRTCWSKLFSVSEPLERKLYKEKCAESAPKCRPKFVL